jgi:protein-disulfide isomerase
MPPLRREAPRRRPGPIALTLAGAALLTAVLIAASLASGSGEDDPAPAAATAVTAAPSALLRGIPQDGVELGRPDAPVTLVEFADLQCPWCARWSREVFPTLVDEYVRKGRVRIVFRGLFFLGSDSERALRAVLAAGEQDRLWDAVHALYERQGQENSGWVTDELLRSLAGTGIDVDRMLAETGSAAVERELAAAGRAAQVAGVRGTPTFQLGRTGAGLAPLHVDILDAAAFRAALDALLAR